MDKGYIENGFIVDLSNSKKTSEVIYELSRVLDMPEAKEKHICLKLGDVNLSQPELTSIKALVELMESQLAFISTSSEETLESATALNIKVSEFTSRIEAPTFENTQSENGEVDNALTNIFGEENSQNSVSLQNIRTVQTGLSQQEKFDEDDIAPVVHHDEAIAQQVRATEIKEETDEEILAQKAQPETLPTLYMRKTVRSGQSISSDGNIIVIGDVNPGAEIIAKGDITVWGVMGGIAHAGSDGNNYARIRALKLNPVQIRIGEIFARRADTVNIPYVQKTSEYIPEEAFAHNGSIIIKKIHEEIKEI